MRLLKICLIVDLQMQVSPEGKQQVKRGALEPQRPEGAATAAQTSRALRPLHGGEGA